MSERKWFVVGFVLGVITGVILTPIMAFAFYISSVIENTEVSAYVIDAQIARTTSGLKAIDTSMIAMCSDADCIRIADLFEAYPGKGAVYGTAEDAQAAVDTLSKVHADAMYALLVDGRNAELPAGFELRDGVRTRLASGYVDLGNDAWGHPYRFFIGPWPEGGVASPFRQYEFAETDDGLLEMVVPSDYEGALEVNDPFCGAPGAAPERGVYVWSLGEDSLSGVGGTGCRDGVNGFRVGDDINNWDPGRGWEAWY